MSFSWYHVICEHSVNLAFVFFKAESCCRTVVFQQTKLFCSVWWCFCGGLQLCMHLWSTIRRRFDSIFFATSKDNFRIHYVSFDSLLVMARKGNIICLVFYKHPVARAALMLGEDHFATSWISGMAPKWVKDSGNGPQMIPPTAPDWFESISGVLDPFRGL